MEKSIQFFSLQGDVLVKDRHKARHDGGLYSSSGESLRYTAAIHAGRCLGDDALQALQNRGMASCREEGTSEDARYGKEKQAGVACAFLLISLPMEWLACYKAHCHTTKARETAYLYVCILHCVPIGYVVDIQDVSCICIAVSIQGVFSTCCTHHKNLSFESRVVLSSVVGEGGLSLISMASLDFINGNAYQCA